MVSSSSPKIDRDVLMQGIVEGIAGFESEFPLEDFKKGDYKQHPIITLLTCSDSRMPVNIFGSIFNRIFSVENIGNQFRSSEGSVLYGLLHLHTPLMIVAGHTDCGAIKAAESNFLNEPLGIRNELSTVKDSLDAARRLYNVSNNDSDLKYTLLSEVNVDMQINYLLANPGISELVKNKELLIMGVMADLHNHYGEGYGRTYTINVNGEKDTSKLKDNNELGLMAERAKRLSR